MARSGAALAGSSRVAPKTHAAHAPLCDGTAIEEKVMPAPPFGGTWCLANIYGIGGTDTGSDHLAGPWIAGHVNDAIVARGQGSDGLLVATDAAGVWWVQPFGSGRVAGAA